MFGPGSCELISDPLAYAAELGSVTCFKPGSVRTSKQTGRVRCQDRSHLSERVKVLGCARRPGRVRQRVIEHPGCTVIACYRPSSQEHTVGLPKWRGSVSG